MTLTELTVVAGILGVTGAVAAKNVDPFVDAARAAVLAEDLHVMTTAVVTALVFQDLPDADGDGDRLDDLVTKGYVEGPPLCLPGATWRLEVDAEGRYRFEVACGEASAAVLAKVDRTVDRATGPADGKLQWRVHPGGSPEGPASAASTPEESASDSPEEVFARLFPEDHRRP